jgi:hypothetical protein
MKKVIMVSMLGLMIGFSDCKKSGPELELTQL